MPGCRRKFPKPARSCFLPSWSRHQAHQIPHSPTVNHCPKTKYSPRTTMLLMQDHQDDMQFQRVTRIFGFMMVPSSSALNHACFEYIRPSSPVTLKYLRTYSPYLNRRKERWLKDVPYTCPTTKKILWTCSMPSIDQSAFHYLSILLTIPFSSSYRFPIRKCQLRNCPQIYARNPSSQH